MNKIHFIINPISGIGKKNILPEKIKTYLSKSLDFEIHYTKYAGHGYKIANYLAKENAYMVVAVGGDGSVNEIASALVHSDTLFGVIPTGSGNGFAHHFDIPEKISKAIEIINKGQYTSSDIGAFDKHYFCSNLGIGLDAVIAKEFSQFGKRGFWSYIKLSVKNYFNYSSGITTIEIDGKEKQFENTLFVSIANTSEFGNRFQIAPDNNHQDGKFELVVFRKPPLLFLPFTVLRFFTKSVRKSKYVSHFEGSEAKITKPKAIQKDGDWIDENIEIIDVKIIRNAVKVVC